ncbi:MAG: hypothetical protein ABIA74_06235 [bacterium]
MNKKNLIKTLFMAISILIINNDIFAMGKYWERPGTRASSYLQNLKRAKETTMTGQNSQFNQIQELIKIFDQYITELKSAIQRPNLPQNVLAELNNAGTWMVEQKRNLETELNVIKNQTEQLDGLFDQQPDEEVAERVENVVTYRQQIISNIATTGMQLFNSAFNTLNAVTIGTGLGSITLSLLAAPVAVPVGAAVGFGIGAGIAAAGIGTGVRSVTRRYMDRPGQPRIEEINEEEDMDLD